MFLVGIRTQWTQTIVMVLCPPSWMRARSMNRERLGRVTPVRLLKRGPDQPLVREPDETRSTVGQHGKQRLGRAEPLQATGDRYREAIALSVNQESHRL